MIQLHGKVAIVTGGARGIGREIAATLVQCGARVMIADINANEAAQTAEQIGASWSKTDITNQADVQQLVNQTIESFGQIDILVNNAGIIGLGSIEDLSLEEWNRMMAVHVTGSFLCAQAVIPHMKKHSYGKIINISSNWGQRGASEAVHYSTAKAAILGFTKALAREVAKEGILVNAIAPGPIETEMLSEEGMMLGITTEQVRYDLQQGIPLRRLGTTRDVAGAVAYLASDLGDFFTGQVLSPNGGEVMV